MKLSSVMRFARLLAAMVVLSVRADDLAALPIKELMKRNPDVDWSKVDDVYYGCVNQAGEDNRNVARMAFTGGFITGGSRGDSTRLCASGMEAVNSSSCDPV